MPGADIFAVLAYDGTEAPVVITDFDARRDTLEIAVEDTTFQPATEDDFTFIIDGPQGHVRVELAGHTLAVLENTTEVPENVFFFRDDLLGLIEEYRALEARETAAARAAAAQGAIRAAPPLKTGRSKMLPCGLPSLQAETPAQPSRSRTPRLTCADAPPRACFPAH